ncbi:MAG: AAA family ATPase, partial [Muribaculaceae bacterium]|nr:AAA family ATPase [Muribaculaceae bacterium]
YNILLQVMDYATLTDNQGRTADFSNVILIMTSNAGAQHANKASVGFASRTSAGEAMLKEVKRVFKPEFLNRLSGIEVFHDMDREMARLILDKSLRALEDLLSARNINIEMDEDVREWLMGKGFTPEYGARELERVITRYLKKPLSKEILLGALKNG